jgi:hypothetical protein
MLRLCRDSEPLGGLHLRRQRQPNDRAQVTRG